MARHGGTPRGHRPKACTETTRARTGRSLVCPVQTGPCREAERRTPMMNRQGKSDGRVVPAKSLNKAGQQTAAEEMEGSLPAKGNSPQQNIQRIQGRERMQNAVGRVRQRALKDKKLKFTSLMHHITAIDTLREADYSLKRDAAAGIDGQTWRHYEESLEENLQDLFGRLKRGAYRAKPVRRTYIPKADGKQRPLGVPVLEDKIV